MHASVRSTPRSTRRRPRERGTAARTVHARTLQRALRIRDDGDGDHAAASHAHGRGLDARSARTSCMSNPPAVSDEGRQVSSRTRRASSATSAASSWPRRNEHRRDNGQPRAHPPDLHGCHHFFRPASRISRDVLFDRIAGRWEVPSESREGPARARLLTGCPKKPTIPTTPVDDGDITELGLMMRTTSNRRSASSPCSCSTATRCRRSGGLIQARATTAATVRPHVRSRGSASGAIRRRRPPRRATCSSPTRRRRSVHGPARRRDHRFDTTKRAARIEQIREDV